MNMARLKHGDTVEVNVRGRVFRATFDGTTMDDRVHLTDLPRWCSYHYVAKRDVQKRIKFDPAATQHKG